MPLETLAHLNGRIDSNGSLLIAQVAAGTDGPLTPCAHVRATSTTTTAYLSTADKTEGAGRTPFTPFGHLRGRGDGTSLLVGTLAAAGSNRTPATPLLNLPVKTDENGYVLIAVVAAGTPGPIAPLSQLKCLADENGALICAVGP